VKRMFTPLAVGAAAWLLVACGGGDSPGAVSGDAAQAAAQRATGASYLVPAPEGAAASRIDSRFTSAVFAPLRISSRISSSIGIT